MPFTDFTTQGTDDNVVINEFFGPRRLGPIAGTEQDTPHLAEPLVDTGSLQMRLLGTNLHGHIYRTDASKRGYVTGAIKSQWYAAVDDALRAYAFGMYCYGSQVSLVSAGNCYLMGAVSRLPGPIAILGMFLAKSAGGLAAFPGGMTVLASTPTQWAEESSFWTQLVWIQTPTSVILEAYKGPSATSLVKVLTYEDMSPLVSPVVDGLWAGCSTSDLCKVFADETHYYNGVP